MYNILSVVLVLMSWAIPLILIVKNKNNKSIGKYQIMSMTFCATAFILQFLDINSRVTNGDFTALMDTMGALICVSIISLIITISLNILIEKINNIQK